MATRSTSTAPTCKTCTRMLPTLHSTFCVAFFVSLYLASEQAFLVLFFFSSSFFVAFAVFYLALFGVLIMTRYYTLFRFFLFFSEYMRFQRSCVLHACCYYIYRKTMNAERGRKAGKTLVWTWKC